MCVNFLNEIHAFIIVHIFYLVRELISVLWNISAAVTFPFLFELVRRCVNNYSNYYK